MCLGKCILKEIVGGGTKGRKVWGKASVSLVSLQPAAQLQNMHQAGIFGSTALTLSMARAVRGQWDLDFCLGLKAWPSYK